jgi:LPS O-antigen subunit length determinant protein (WzzB/FepE family)
MAPRKSTTAAIQPIDTSALGEYNTSDHCEKQYATVYYALRELQGLSVKRSLGDSFSWDELKERFTEVFGTVEERRYSLEQLLEYAGRKFGKSLQDLQEINDRSWARRKARQEQQNNVVELPTTAEF